MSFTKKFHFDRIFSSFMVLQQGEPIRFSGVADPGKQVELRFADQLHQVVAGEDRWWHTVFPARTSVSWGRNQH